MIIESIVYKNLRIFKDFKLAYLSNDICSESALSQFEKGKIDLNLSTREKINKKLDITISPTTDDIDKLQVKVYIFNQTLEEFDFNEADSLYTYILFRQEYIYFNISLLLDCFINLCIYEFIRIRDFELASKRLLFLDSFIGYMSSEQKVLYYFNKILKSHYIDKDYNTIMHFYDLLREIKINEFIKYWVSSILLYYNKNLLSMKLFSESSVSFRLTNNVRGVLFLNISFAQLMLQNGEFVEAKKYVDDYFSYKLKTRFKNSYNDVVMNYICAQLDYKDMKYSSARTYLIKALKIIKDINVDNELFEGINVLLLRTLKKMNYNRDFEELMFSLKRNIDYSVCSLLTTYYLYVNDNYEQMKNYMRKTIFKKYNQVSVNTLNIISKYYILELEKNRRYLEITKLYKFLSTL